MENNVSQFAMFENNFNTNSQLSIFEESKLNNFKKINFEFNEITFELGISLYSNLVFVILMPTTNLKPGSFWQAEIEEENEEGLVDDDEEEIGTKLKSDVKCLLGNRKDEASNFFSNFIINFVSNGIKKSIGSGHILERVKKVLFSFSIKFSDIVKDNSNHQSVVDISLTEDFKSFINITCNKLSEILKI
jgi:hypothetical protein